MIRTRCKGISFPSELIFRPNANTIPDPDLTLAVTVTYDMIAMVLVLG